MDNKKHKFNFIYQLSYLNYYYLLVIYSSNIILLYTLNSLKKQKANHEIQLAKTIIK